MKKILRIASVLFVLLPVLVKAEIREVPFTLDDRDRMIRTEQNINAIKAEMDARFESVDVRFVSIDKRFDRLFNFLWAIIGIFTTMIVSVFGFAFWDRKLSLAPMKREEEKIKTVLRELSKSQPKLAGIMRQAGML
ncbi:MAG: hypothetical protein WCI48_04795 [Bacteroidota bacterium]|jgi:hypothetical protein